MTITLNVSDEQEAFTAVKAHLEKMTVRAVDTALDGTPKCVYRVGQDPSGNRCAIGALIPDDQYTPELDSNYTGGAGIFILVKNDVIGTDISVPLLSDLQKVHDSLPYWENWESGVRLSSYGQRRLAFIAQEYGLVYK